ncbi:hypothetical protein [Aquirufa regiilacus]|uniref:Uncharacterized protein n=1 Tax=Aquirufa regiilacus TaxID=3024868 RepID=A0ABU3TVE5_9BACT|nr:MULTISPECIES: hypothetical protein [unclassified Aquirufa]MDT8888312.1 hypothetical protein [Aquirufa sp. LEPPI-3A]MDU0809607.1 hypothetical protein [Aquirufa sp. LEOWEIH-7C]
MILYLFASLTALFGIGFLATSLSGGERNFKYFLLVAAVLLFASYFSFENESFWSLAIGWLLFILIRKKNIDTK